MDQRKLDVARRALGVDTETEAIDQALDLVAFREELARGFAAVRSMCYEPLLAPGTASVRASSHRQELDDACHQVVHPADDVDGLFLFEIRQNGAAPADVVEAEQDIRACDRVDVAAFLLDFAPSKLVAVIAGFTRASNPVKLPISTSSIAPLIAPQAVCPKSRITFAPATAHANSRLPIRSSFTTLPAMRALNVSPMPASKMISAGARESMHPRTTAAGN